VATDESVPCIDDLQCGQQVPQCLELSCSAVERQDELGERNVTVGWRCRCWECCWCHGYNWVIHEWVGTTWYSITSVNTDTATEHHGDHPQPTTDSATAIAKMVKICLSLEGISLGPQLNTR